MITLFRSANRNPSLLACCPRLLCRRLSQYVSHRAQRELGGNVTMFASILQKARDTPGLVDLGQGFPNFLGNEAARQQAIALIQSDAMHNQYTPPMGLQRLRSAVRDYYEKFYGAEYCDQTEICITTSGTEAIFSAMQAIINPGDRVILFEPFWPWYLPCIRMAGGEPIVLRLHPPSFAIDPVELERAFTHHRPKCIIINSPHNPTGHVLSVPELTHIAHLCRAHDAVCLADEVYENAVFAGGAHRRAADAPGMRPRTVTVGSASKLYSATGWRVGWAVGPPDLIAAVNVCHQHSSVCAPTPLQAGVAAALESEDGLYGGVASLYEDNYRYLRDALVASGRADVCPAEGGYFLVADVTKSGMNDTAFVSYLIQHAKVAGMPMRAFYTSELGPAQAADSPGPRIPCTSLVRFAICKSRETIEDACARIRALPPMT